MQVSKSAKNDSNVVELESAKFSSIEEVMGILENAPINIMYCDRDLIIRYVNPQSKKTLQQLVQFLPIGVEEIEGSKIDVFHKNPSYQQGILANSSNLPIRTTIDVGPEKLDLLVSAIFNSDNTYTGAMVTWDVVTKKLESEAEMARIQSMVENAPINLMMANTDFEITYLNPKSLKTLREIEHLLPIKADQVEGSSIDVFHKNPEHQKKMLSDPNNLPHNAKIKLGDETLNLLVSAIYDSVGTYMGPMVTWEVVTDRLALVNTLEETSTQLSASAEELSATATQMSQNAVTTSEQSNTAAAAAEEVSKGVETVATNTEEMTSSIKEIAKSSSEAANISKEALEKANETNVTITHLGEASQEIGNVIKVISSIAQQTNLLALNATIEAARAGDAGKGFAVVANEVKELAKQTAKATEDITLKISNIQETSKASVDAIGIISEIIEKLNSIAMSIAASVEEQTATTNEVSRVVLESKKGVEGISETIQTVAKAADQSSSGAGQTLEAARGLTDLAEKLKGLVNSVEI